MRTLALVPALLLLSAPAARAASLPACTVADIIAKDGGCPSGTGPCNITKDFTIGDGCTLDFGTRAVTIAGSTVINVVSHTVTILAGSLTMLPSAAIDGRADQPAPNDRGGIVVIRTTGNVVLQKATGLARIDLSGDRAGGMIRIFAGGNITIGGRLQVDGLTGISSAGTITLDAGGDVITQAGAVVSGGCTQGLGGSLEVNAGGRADLGDVLAFTGGDGGAVTITTGTDIVVRKVLIDAQGDTGGGGSFQAIAGTQLQILDRVIATGSTSVDGMSGGCGGDIDVEAVFGDIIVAGGLSVDGATPDGAGGAIVLTSQANVDVAQAATLTARGSGGQSCGGDIDVDAGRAINARGMFDASAGSGGGSIALAAAGAIQVSGQLMSTADITSSFGGDVNVDAGLFGSGPLSITGTIDVSGGDCDRFNICGLGGIIDIGGCDLTIGATGALIARGGNGGTILATAHEQLTVNGTVSAVKTLGPGLAGQIAFHHPGRKLPLALSTFVNPAAILTPHATCVAVNNPAQCLTACPTCGNGVVDFPETCDTLGTPVSCDGCSVFCQVESCADQNACTIDSCDPTLGCRHMIAPNGTSCSDGLTCTGTEVCSAAFCLRTPLACGDADPCTIDSCVEPGGCLHVQADVGHPCNDGNACTAGDSCNAAGLCTAGPATVCNDNRECTTDTCNPSFGCAAAFRSGPCTDDGNLCTNDSCSAGNCIHPQRSCDDADACTVDSCAPATGCAHTQVPDCVSSTTTSTSTVTTVTVSTTSSSTSTSSSLSVSSTATSSSTSSAPSTAVTTTSASTSSTTSTSTSTTSFPTTTVPTTSSSSLPTTSSTSTSSTSSTTSSTVASCVPTACDDGNPCTVDGCAGPACAHTDRTGVDGVTCAFEARGLSTPLCVGETVPASITKKIGKARLAAAKGKAAATVNKAKKNVKKSATLLRAVQRTITRLEGRGKLSPGCASLLAGSVDDAVVRADRWLAAPAL